MTRVWADLTTKEKWLLNYAYDQLYDQEKATLTIHDDGFTVTYETLTFRLYNTDWSLYINDIRVR
jgi:hypothetical protein